MPNPSLCTVLYYTSNRERPEFEERIQQMLKATIGNLPLISVSQKPIDLGENICVGEHEACDHNLYRQIAIGCQHVNTPYVIVAEADCLYPFEYFEFIPPRLDYFYRYSNVWILYQKFNYYFQKSSSECAMVVGRDFFMQKIERLLAGRSTWKQPGDTPLKHIFREHEFTLYGEGQPPVINIKTKRGLRKFTRTLSNVSDIDTLPYWGSVTQVKQSVGMGGL